MRHCARANKQHGSTKDCRYHSDHKFYWMETVLACRDKLPLLQRPEKQVKGISGTAFNACAWRVHQMRWQGLVGLVTRKKKKKQQQLT